MGDDPVCLLSRHYGVWNRHQGNENRPIGLMIVKAMVEAFGPSAVPRTEQEVGRQEIGAMLLRHLERYWLGLVL